ncbi:hypothetical protein CXF78_10870 [Shewanella sp. 11B5]|uniref:hypothetical protein n=1 Tax=Shewanella sp. 11B5 TaxID=2058298 RepID=UPI000C7DACDC|nr:hypothetical protein [Shewanella sp. 11B5]PKI03803.1 hypothetical protein CXF78_10870 [Shewanella sp. 11B5]
MSKPNNSTIPNIIRVHSGKTYIAGVNAYTQANNQLCDLANLSNSSSKVFKTRLKAWFKDKPSNERLNHFKLLELGRYLSAILMNPLEYGAIPFVDMLYLTIDVPESVVSSLSMAMKSVPTEHFKLYKTGTTKVLKNYKDVYQRFAMFDNQMSSKIIVYWGIHPKVREERPKQRLVKISLNPARHSPAEITAFFEWFKSLLGDDAQHIMEVANITRLDIAMDLIGVPLPYLLVDRTNVKLRSYYLNEKAKKSRVGTQRFGSPKSSKSYVYDKLRKYLDLRICNVDLLVYDTAKKRYVPISRLERVFKFADSKNPISLAQLEKAPYFLKSTVFYNPMILMFLNATQRDRVEKYGFSYWYHMINWKRWKLSRLLLDNRTLDVNDDQLKSVQVAALIRLKKLILEA